MTKHIVCFSGGHSSALTAIEVVRKYGSSNVVLLNHDINTQKEHEDIKRFKREVAAYLELPVTYANILNIQNPDKIPNQFQVCMIAKAFKVSNGQELCTNRLKTTPFYNWLAANATPGKDVIYYGFDRTETDRIIRRRKHLDVMGYESAYPLAEWQQTIRSTVEIGINPPLTYDRFKHGNCFGCLKAGKQHWYVIYCLYTDIWQEAKAAEAYIGYTIHPGESIESLEPLFEAMKLAGIEPTEHIPFQRFWADVEKFVKPKQLGLSGTQNTLFMQMPCECIV